MAEPELDTLLRLLVVDEVECAKVEAIGLPHALAPLGLLRGTDERPYRVLDGRRLGRARHRARDQTCLFEVVGDELRELVSLAGKAVDPAREPAVEDGAELLWQLAVGDVADQDVLEGVLVLSGDAGRSALTHEVSAGQLSQGGLELWRGIVELHDRGWPERDSDHRGVLG